MKYALIDGEIHQHDSETRSYLPLTIAEAQQVVDVLNAIRAAATTLVMPELTAQFKDADALRSKPREPE